MIFFFLMNYFGKKMLVFFDFKRILSNFATDFVPVIGQF